MAQASAIKDYFRDIQTYFTSGDAREHSYRGPLQNLIHELVPGIVAINEPKHIECGAPDYVIKQKQIRLGHIEAKDIDKSLDKVESSEQMRRYLDALPNLILTNYVEFRWYIEGKHRATANLATLSSQKRFVFDKEGGDNVAKLLEDFIKARLPQISSPKELATRMAAIARLVCAAIKETMKNEQDSGILHDQIKSFRATLLPNLNVADFADMYAQTICYGMFAAKCNLKDSEIFSRYNAASHIPKSNPFLRSLFDNIAGANIDENISWAVDDLVELLNRSDMKSILINFGKRTRQEDPVVHFYETFLAEYDSERRKSRGTYYTPEPVVSYITRSVDKILRRDFDLDGLADGRKIEGTDIHKVQILDPATGTGTFLHSIVDIIYESFNGNKGMWPSYVSEHLIPRISAFELMMAPYAVAHMKIGLQLEETGYKFSKNQRLGIYLTNALEKGLGSSVQRLPFARWLAEEASSADNIKHDAPVMVIIGNPPYKSNSENNGEWIKQLVHGKELVGQKETDGFKKTSNYFEVDNKSLDEQNPKNLLNDYVKFIRFAQWRIEQTGYGVLAFITNHGYLSNPTFRGMRQSLLECFDDIYVLDLHGNSRKKDQSPDGTKDENVFDIQQGVAIGIFVKKQTTSRTSHLATVHHGNLWGPRETNIKMTDSSTQFNGKYYWLAQHDVTTTDWATLTPQTPSYLFTPQVENLREEYDKGWNITDIMPANSTGVKTHRDHFVMSFDFSTLHRNLADFRDKEVTDEEIAKKYKLHDTLDWKLSKKRKSLQSEPSWEKHFTKILYRPFDIRDYYHHSDVVERARNEVAKHLLLGKNISLLWTRPLAPNYEFSVFTSKYIPHQCVVGDKMAGAGASYFAPLYTYFDTTNRGLFDMDEYSNTENMRRSNFSPAFIASLSKNINIEFTPDGKGDLEQIFGPEDVFNYIYAVFYSPQYRKRYAEFLRIDFPRIPLTSNSELFRELCKIGNKLVENHMTNKIENFTTMFPEQGTDIVEKVEYLESKDSSKKGRVYINRTQYFSNVPSDVWELHIGGYQVCQKWLKDRKGRRLLSEDFKQYKRIVASLTETIILMEQIDETIDTYGGWPIE